MRTRYTQFFHKSVSALTNIVQGYNKHANRQKFKLIERTFQSVVPDARSFADLGGVWRINAAYTEYTLRNFVINKAFLVDTDFPVGLKQRLSRWKQLAIQEADFAYDDVVAALHAVDVVYFFDVLLHQASPDWHRVLEKYARICRCMIIYNQQWVQSTSSVRLTRLPIEEYVRIVPSEKQELYRTYFERADDIHPKFQKKYIDIHNMWQWGISDDDLRRTMNELGFREVFYKNFGQFVNLQSFENHAFIFLKRD